VLRVNQVQQDNKGNQVQSAVSALRAIPDPRATRAPLAPPEARELLDRTEILALPDRLDLKVNKVALGLQVRQGMWVQQDLWELQEVQETRAPMVLRVLRVVLETLEIQARRAHRVLKDHLALTDSQGHLEPTESREWVVRRVYLELKDLRELMDYLVLPEGWDQLALRDQMETRVQAVVLGMPERRDSLVPLETQEYKANQDYKDHLEHQAPQDFLGIQVPLGFLEVRVRWELRE